MVQPVTPGNYSGLLTGPVRDGREAESEAKKVRVREGEKEKQEKPRRGIGSQSIRATPTMNVYCLRYGFLVRPLALLDLRFAFALILGPALSRAKSWERSSRQTGTAGAHAEEPTAFPPRGRGGHVSSPTCRR